MSKLTQKLTRRFVRRWHRVSFWPTSADFGAAQVVSYLSYWGHAESRHRIRLVPIHSIASSAGSKIDVGTDRVSAFAWRSLCQMPLCPVGVGLGLLREQGAGGTVHLHRDLVERAGRRVMRKADSRNVL